MTEPQADEALGAALALLTLITGDDWDRAKLIEQSGQLREVAAHTLRKQGLTESDAATFVDERWNAYASDILPQVPTAAPSPSTQTDGDLSPTANAEAIAAQIPSPGDMQSRLADYLARKSDA